MRPTPQLAKQAEREKLAKDMAEYLAKGGTIKKDSSQPAEVNRPKGWQRY